ncbi:MAG: hypothetical protein HY996_09445, partial [Micrococcales bacterium]|nr:hypothetical protein [Micrococcales bacterium]
MPWLGLVLVAGGLVFLLLLLSDAHYYLLPLASRSAARAHHALRPSGSAGHLYGWIGTAIITSNLLYLARRRFARLRALGSMQFWLGWHVTSGLLGPLLIVLHSALTLRTTVAIVSAASLSVLVVTGLVGRYLYALVPHAGDGGTRHAEDVRAELDRALMQLRSVGDAARAAAAAIDAEADRVLLPLIEGGGRGGRVVIVAIRAR